MSIKIAVIANCQASPLYFLLPYMSSDIEVVKIPPVHTIAKKDVRIVLDAVNEVDYVIHQPIGADFGPISVENIKIAAPRKQYISFPSIYFSGLLPHLSYLRSPNTGSIQSPLGDYHDIRILRAFLDGKSIDQCIATVDDFPFDGSHFFQSCLAESRRREVGLDVRVMDRVEEQIQTSQTFYTFNHVDNQLMWYVAEKTLEIISAKRDKAVRPPVTKLLGTVIAGVPERLCEEQRLEWRNPQYSLLGTPLDLRQLASESYAIYQSIADLRMLIEFNRHRFAPGII